MENLTKYRAIIEEILIEIARVSSGDADIEEKTIFDREADSYALVSIGWNKARRVHHFVVHLEVINGKVWIQEDNTDLIVAHELERAGIPKSDIVLGFHPPDVRPHTEYAAA